MFFGDDCDFAPISSTASDLTVSRVNGVHAHIPLQQNPGGLHAAEQRVHTPAHVNFQLFGDVASGIYVCRVAREYFGPRQFALGF